METKALIVHVIFLIPIWITYLYNSDKVFIIDP